MNSFWEKLRGRKSRKNPQELSAGNYSADALRNLKEKTKQQKEAENAEYRKKDEERSKKLQEDLNKHAPEFVKQQVIQALENALKDGPELLKFAAKNDKELRITFKILTPAETVFAEGVATEFSRGKGFVYIAMDHMFWRWFFKGLPNDWEAIAKNISGKELTEPIETLAAELPQYKELRNRYGYRILVEGSIYGVNLVISAETTS